MTNEQIREEAKKVFLEHEITIIENTKNVQMFLCRKPGTWEYGFQLVCAENMICMTGDVYSMLVEPGYGRSGLAFLRGSVNSESYFLSKIRISKDYEEYREERAKAALQELRLEVTANLNEELEDALDDEDRKEAQQKADKRLEEIDDVATDMGEHEFYRTWHDVDCGETPNVMDITGQTIYQLEGLRSLCRKLDEMNFKIGETK